MVTVKHRREHYYHRLRTPLIIIGLMGVGLLLRLWFISVNELDPQLSPADDGDYYQRALRFATTGEYIDDFWLIRPPLHVMMFALMIRISIIMGTIPGVSLIRVAQIVLSLLAIPVGYSLAKRLFDRKTGIIFGSFLALWFPLVELPAHLFTEPLFVFLLLMHLWLLVVWRDTLRWPYLAGSAVALGLTALTRSVAIYGALFILSWFLIEAWYRRRSAPPPAEPLEAGQGQEPDISETPPAPPPTRLDHIKQTIRGVWQWSRRPLAIFILLFALVIVPWTIRNYIVYQRVILVDTIGSVNLWLHMEKYEEKGVEILKQIPQRDRQAFAVADTRRMFFEDPLNFWQMLWRNAWLHFLHIWKGQFIEDFFLKSSFYGRPLRAVWPLGIAGEILWFLFSLGGLIGLVLPAREGTFRWIAWGWAGYTMLTVMLFHVEPRYLMPLWLILMLYGAWVIGNARDILSLLRRHWLYGGVVAAIAVAFLVAVFTYRNYPETLTTGFSREYHRHMGVRAFEEGDYEAAVEELRAAVDAQPHFVSSHTELGLALVAQGSYEEAAEVVGKDDAQHMLLARGALAQAQGKDDQAADLFTKAEKKAGDDMQRMGDRWIIPPATALLNIGTGQGIGYIEGFSLPEESPGSRSYRWLQGTGSIEMPLPAPLTADSIVMLRMAGADGQENQLGTPTTVTFLGEEGESLSSVSFRVAGGRWHTYRLVIPEAQAGSQTLHMRIEAPTFIPAHRYPDSNDIRPVSLMMQAVWVNQP